MGSRLRISVLGTKPQDRESGIRNLDSGLLNLETRLWNKNPGIKEPGIRNQELRLPSLLQESSLCAINQAKSGCPESSTEMEEVSEEAGRGSFNGHSLMETILEEVGRLFF